MPDFYAHQTFGALVWDQLPEGLRGELAPVRAGFQLGLYGPDPLFFYHPLWPNPVSREGHRLHHCPPEDILGRYLGPGALENPYALSYAVGFLCHYLLDAACHPYINAAAGKKRFGSTFIEGALDRFLSPPGKAGLPVKLPRDAALYDAAAVGYTDASGPQAELAARRFRQVSWIIAHFRHRSPHSRARAELAAQLKETLENTVDTAAEMAVQLADALRSGASLDFLPTLDFNGAETRKAAPV